MSPALRIEALDKALEIAFLLRASEAGYARDYRSGPAFGAEGDARRLDAFRLGMLDSLGQTLDFDGMALPLLVYMDAVIDLGPGEGTRERTGSLLRLFDPPELRRYIAGGRLLIVRLLADGTADGGLFARLLEDELKET